MFEENDGRARSSQKYRVNLFDVTTSFTIFLYDDRK